MTLSPAQRDFLALHVKRAVMRWQWHLMETQLRAHSAHRTATLDRVSLAGLIDAYLMEHGAGVSVRATAAGRAAIAALESEVMA